MSTTVHTVPHACTTADAVQREAINPTMDTIARGHRQRELLIELAGLIAASEDDLRRALALLDHAHARLDHAERAGTYDALPPSRNGKLLAAEIRPLIDTLKDSRLRRQHDQARADLHCLFDAHGDELLKRSVLYGVGKNREFTLRGEYADWRLAR
jgi:hypothetical protein